ncbi:MAG: hypothetical protein ACXVCY_05365 [Pseudobdellovibrionaceae bacterium]
MKYLILILYFLFGTVTSIFFMHFFKNSYGALPSHFSECLSENTGTNMTIADILEIAKISKVTYCQNQMGLANKEDTMTLLRNPNIQVGISLSRTAYLVADLLDLATAGSYLLYVDSTKLARDDLISLAQAGVQLVIMTVSSGLARDDLLAIARVKSFILNVNSAVLASDLQDYIRAGVQIVIRSSQSGLSRADIIDVALVNSEMVTVMP